MMTRPSLSSFPPFKSPAIALIFCVFLGPVGLLYSSFWGGVSLIMVSIIFISGKLFFLTLLLWIICCIWAVAAVERYNKLALRTQNRDEIVNAKTNH